MTQMFAHGELLDPVTLLIVTEADEASRYPVVDKRFTISHDAHLDKVLRIDTLLKHIVDAVLTQSFHCRLMLLYRLLDISERAFVHLTGHFLIMIDSS